MENKYSKINRKKKEKITIPTDKYTVTGDKFTLTGDKYALRSDKYTLKEDKHTSKEDKYTVTADVSSVLKAINENTCWKSSSTKLCKSSLLTTKHPTHPPLL